VVLASDEEQLRGLTELLVDELGSDGPQLAVHKSSGARDRIADPRDARSSSIALVSRTAADTLALGIRASVRLKPRGLESR
jgi:hypothetical protein